MIITFTFTITRISNKYFITYSLANQFFAFTSAFIIASSLNLYVQVSCHSMRLVSLVLGTRLNALTFILLTTLGTHNFEYGPLILLQLTLHLLILTH